MVGLQASMVLGATGSAQGALVSGAGSARLWRAELAGQIAAFEQADQVVAVPALEHRLGASAQLVVVEKSLPPGHFLGRPDAQSLPVLDGADEVAGVVERLERAGVEPGRAAGEHLHLELAAFEVDPVDV